MMQLSNGIEMPHVVTSYDDLLGWLDKLKFNDFLPRANLDYFREIMRIIDNPDENMGDVLHITGTNGKGSISSMLTFALRQNSREHRVGLYTSPHLHRVNERIEINGVPISDTDMVRITNYVLQQLKAGLPNEHLGPVGLFVCIAFVYFQEEQVSHAVIEAGIGAKLDHTNILMPIFSVITSVGLDHQRLLGRTSVEILRDKAEIIKPGKAIIIGQQIAQASELLSVIQTKARSVGSAVLYDHTPGKDTYQTENCHTAIIALRHYLGGTYQPPPYLSQMVLAGRFQQVRTSIAQGELVFDYAHNQPAISGLLALAAETFPDQHVHCVFAMQKKKDYRACSEILQSDEVVAEVGWLIDDDNFASFDEIASHGKFKALASPDEIQLFIADKAVVLVFGSFMVVNALAAQLQINLVQLQQKNKERHLQVHHQLEQYRHNKSLTKRSAHKILLQQGMFKDDDKRRRSYALACETDTRQEYLDKVSTVLLPSSPKL